MEYSKESKIKIQIDNNNCIISGFNTYKTNSNISTNNNTKTSSIKKFQKNLQNNLDNENSLSISKSTDNNNYNNNDLSMIEITEKSIFSSEFNNGSFYNKSPETKKKNKEKRIKKMKEAVIRKLNFDLPSNNNINTSKNKKKQENKYPLLNKIILDTQQKPPDKKLKNNVITKKITKKIKINLNFKEINLRKNNSFKKNNNDSKEKCNTINNITNKNNIILLNKNKNISFHNIFNSSNKNNIYINNINYINFNSKENKKVTTTRNSIKKQKNDNKIKKQLSLTLNNKENNLKDNNHNHVKPNKKYKHLMLNYLNRNSINKFCQISTQRYNTCLTTINNSSIFKKDNNDSYINNKQNKLLCIKDKIKKTNLKSSNNSVNHSRRNTLSDYEYDINKNNKIYNYNNYNISGNSLRTSTTRGKVRNNYSKIKILKKMLIIFGKELYNPIESKPNEKINKKIKDLNVISDNKAKISKSLNKKNN